MLFSKLLKRGFPSLLYMCTLKIQVLHFLSAQVKINLVYQLIFLRITNSECKYLSRCIKFHIGSWIIWVPNASVSKGSEYHEWLGNLISVKLTTHARWKQRNMKKKYFGNSSSSTDQVFVKLKLNKSIFTQKDKCKWCLTRTLDVRLNSYFTII